MLPQGYGPRQCRLATQPIKPGNCDWRNRATQRGQSTKGPALAGLQRAATTIGRHIRTSGRVVAPQFGGGTISQVFQALDRGVAKSDMSDLLANIADRSFRRIRMSTARGLGPCHSYISYNGSTQTIPNGGTLRRGRPATVGAQDVGMTQLPHLPNPSG